MRRTTQKPIVTCLFLFFLIFPFTSLLAQVEVKGMVTDSTTKGIQEATVVLFFRHDTSYVTHTLSNSSGEYQFKRLSLGKYWIRIMKPGFQIFTDTLSIRSLESIQLSVVQLSVQNYVLDEVDILGELSPVLVNGDTVSFNASSFGTRKNAMLDQLIEQLPGMEIDDNGDVMAQGQKVGNIKLNGKTFFGQNTEIALKNIPADLIDKVEIISTKIEQTDGTITYEPVINIKLKKESRRGYFGNLEGGYGFGDGLDNRFVAKAGIHRFSSNSQLSILAMGNNINAKGFSWNEMEEFMGGWNYMMPALNNGEMFWYYSEEGALSRQFGSNSGFTTTYGFGSNLNLDLSKKTSLNFNYIFGDANQIRRQVGETSTILEENTLTNSYSNTALDNKQTHALTLHVNHKIDSLSSFNFAFKAGMDFNANTEERNSSQENSERILINQQEGELTKDQLNYMGTSTLTYSRDFARSDVNFYLSLALSGNMSDWNSNSTNLLTYLDSTQDENIVQNDLKEELNGASMLRAGLRLPLGKGSDLKLNLGYAFYLQSNQSSRNLFQNEDILSGELVFNPDLSANFDQKTNIHTPRIGFYYSKKDKANGWRIGMAAELKQLNLTSVYVTGNASLNRDFTYILPNGRLNYRGKNGFYFSLNNFSRIEIPTISQLQPFIFNASPLNVRQGNPNLTPAISHNIMTRSGFRPKGKSWSFNFYVNSYLTQNNIITMMEIDSLGRTSRMPINQGSALSNWGYLGINSTANKIDLNVNPYLRFNTSQRLIFINSSLDNIASINPEFGMNLSNRKNKKIRWKLGASFDLTQTLFEVNTERNWVQFKQSYLASVNLTPNDYFAIGTRLNYEIYAGSAFPDEQRVPIWSFDFSYFPRANSRWEIKLVGQDLLNRNLGVNRQINNNVVTETISETIGRYFLLTAVYRLSKLSVSEGKSRYRK
ncbi:MAG: TonB-dependent receptor family protein [Bacteroidia bacterium]|nr:TonB-dependent receptor family protein [Bacteroidia bacterium]